MMRLNKYLAQSGVASRRKCDDLISRGAVSINGKSVTELGIKIDPHQDHVCVNGKPIHRQRRAEYVLLNKPKGVVSTAADDKRRKTVLDLVPSKARLFPVGRLDIDTTGLLLLTNDGELAYRLTHPKFEINKVYEVVLDQDLSDEDRSKIESGIVLEEGKTSACRIVFPVRTSRKIVRLTMHQGWKRQIKRMFDTVGYTVADLRRLQLGCLKIEGLNTGAWRKLTAIEIHQIKKMAGLQNGN